MSHKEATLSRSPGPVDSSGLGLLALLTAVWTLLLLPALAPASLRDGCLAASCVYSLGDSRYICSSCEARVTRK